MDKWLIFGGTGLYALCAIGMLDFMHQARYSSRVLRIAAAALWPLALASMGVGVLLEVFISALVDAL
jgi:hypothetical protein